MREALPVIAARWREGKRVALATVAKTWGSAPRPLGSKMLVGDGADIWGSVSGGCVEGSVVEVARRVLDTGEPELVSFGVSDEKAWSVGLSCGGEVEVFVEPARRGYFQDGLIEGVLELVAERRSFVQAVVVRGAALGRRLIVGPGGETFGDLGGPRLNQRAALFAETLFDSGTSARKLFKGAASECDVLFDLAPVEPRLVIVGAVHVAIALVSFAKLLGFHTTVMDPRSAFATEERFAEADRLLCEWPQDVLTDEYLSQSSYVAVLSHDPKIDLPALMAALRSPARYIGALGSRKTHAKRLEALKEEGFTAEELERIHAPIGLKLGGRRAEEIALAIAAEMTSCRYGR